MKEQPPEVKEYMTTPTWIYNHHLTTLYYIMRKSWQHEGTAVRTEGTLDACHEKTQLKVFVIVIPKEGWARMATLNLLLVWHRLFRIWLCWHHRLYSWKVGVIPKEGWMRPRAPILLLVWQRQRPWGMFSCDTRHLTTMCYINWGSETNCLIQQRAVTMVIFPGFLLYY